MAEPTTVVITTAEFREGQRAAWEDFNRDHGMLPHMELLVDHTSAEFRSGYLYEFENFIAVTPAHRAARAEALGTTL